STLEAYSWDFLRLLRSSKMEGNQNKSRNCDEEDFFPHVFSLTFILICLTLILAFSQKEKEQERISIIDLANSSPHSSAPRSPHQGSVSSRSIPACRCASI